MLADLLYQVFPYQIFRSILFRAGMGYLTAYFLISAAMPFCIEFFRRRGFVSDFRDGENSTELYSGPTPILGGAILILAILASTLMWSWLNLYVAALLSVMAVFGLVGLTDDAFKIRAAKTKGTANRPAYAEKADGVSGKIRLAVEFAFTLGVFYLLVSHFGVLQTELQIPGVPIKNYLPALPEWLFVPFAAFVVVGGANAVNLSDGLDTLASVPLLSALFFTAAASYIGAEIFWTDKLKLVYLGEDMKQVSIMAVTVIGALICFLKYNSPPANIYLGDVGSLGIGSTVCLIFVLIKAELFLPIVGGCFVISALSSMIQRTWFALSSFFRGREYAERNRFFYKAPYHHHNQNKYDFHPPKIDSLYARLVSCLVPAWWPKIDRYASKDDINNKVIWHSHIKTVWFLVIAFVIYFKVR